jgi:phosphate transport system permease protein
MTSAAVRDAAAHPLRRPLTAVERLNPAKKITMLAAGAVIAIVAVLLAFISWNGIQLFLSGYPLSLIVDPTWNPSSETNPTFGLLPFIAGTIGVMVVAAIISTPLSVGLALFMAEIAPRWARSITQPAMEVFVGIPSVVWGLLGLTVLVPFLRQNFRSIGFTFGFSWFAGSLVLSLMILPTITSIAYDALIVVPRDLRTGSLALGTTRWQTIRHVVLPTAATGIATGVVLGMMRAAGEALAVQMVIGNRPVIPTALTAPVTTLTSQITLDMGNTVQGEPWNQALWTMGLILLLISFGFVSLVRYLARRSSMAHA